MGVEIERKFIVNKQRWEEAVKSEPYYLRQGYLLTDADKTIRVRETSSKGFFTIKGISSGASRQEFEYEIPVEEAKELLNSFSISELSKYRYEIYFAGKLWEVDVFHDANEGLIVAEIELNSEDELFELPDWVTEEVTNDPRYYNSNLTLLPFKKWK